MALTTPTLTSRPTPTSTTRTPDQAYREAFGGGAPMPGPAGAYIQGVATGQTPTLNVGTPADYGAISARQAADNASIGLERGLQFFQGIYGPDLAAQQAQRDRLQGGIGFAEQNYATQADILRNQYGIDTDKLGLEQQGIGIERGAVNRQIGNVGQLENLARQLLGNTQRGFDIDSKEATQGYFAQRRRALSDAASRGAFNTPGIRYTLAEIGDVLGNTQGRIGLGRERADIGYQREGIGLKEQRAGLQDRNKQLDLRAQGLGLDRRQLANNLDQGLNRLGLDQWVTTNDLLDAMASSDIQTRAVAEQIYRNALDYSDFFAGLDPAGVRGFGVVSNPVPTSDTRTQGRPGRRAQ